MDLLLWGRWHHPTLQLSCPAPSVAWKRVGVLFTEASIGSLIPMVPAFLIGTSSSYTAPQNLA